MDIKKVTEENLPKAFIVLKELRPHLSFEEFIVIYEQSQKNDEYELAAVYKDQSIVAVMGYRILYDLVRGKHIYIDDLVTAENARSKGFGAKLLAYAEQIAIQKNCKTLRLCTGIENERGVQFYEKNNWTRRAYAYTKKLK